MDQNIKQILYRSSGHLRRLYRQLEDQPDEIRTHSTEETSNGIEGEISLSDLLTAISGIKLKGKISNTTKSAEEEVEIRTTDIVDQELAVADQLAGYDIPNIDSIGEKYSRIPHFFQGEIELSNDIKNNAITVNYSSDDIVVTGSTSEENWVTSSTLNNLMLSSPLTTCGLCIPLDVSNGESRTSVTAQYILIILEE